MKTRTSARRQAQPKYIVEGRLVSPRIGPWEDDVFGDNPPRTEQECERDIVRLCELDEQQLRKWGRDLQRQYRVVEVKTNDHP